MIWIMIILFLKRVIKGFKKQRAQNTIPPKANFLITAAVILISMIPAKAQTKHLSFHIQKGEKVLGKVQLRKIMSNDSIIYEADNQIMFKFLRRFRIDAKESSIYLHNQLQYSEISRSINGSKKPRVRLTYDKGKYQASRGKDIIELPEAAIATNLISLYFNEPYDGLRVYCDYHLAFSRVSEISEGTYRVDLPNGGRNIFQYNNGQCVRVTAIQPFFKVQLIALNNE